MLQTNIELPAGISSYIQTFGGVLLAFIWLYGRIKGERDATKNKAVILKLAQIEEERKVYDQLILALSSENASLRVDAEYLHAENKVLRKKLNLPEEDTTSETKLPVQHNP